MNLRILYDSHQCHPGLLLCQPIENYCIGLIFLFSAALFMALSLVNLVFKVLRCSCELVFIWFDMLTELQVFHYQNPIWGYLHAARYFMILNKRLVRPLQWYNWKSLMKNHRTTLSWPHQKHFNYHEDLCMLEGDFWIYSLSALLQSSCHSRWNQCQNSFTLTSNCCFKQSN